MLSGHTKVRGNILELCNPLGVQLPACQIKFDVLLGAFSRFLHESVDDMWDYWKTLFLDNVHVISQRDKQASKSEMDQQ